MVGLLIIVRELEKGGNPSGWLKVAVAPFGKPSHDKTTSCEVPDSRSTCTEMVSDPASGIDA